ncbi:MAG TPA: pyridoxamine 5'-phosphate oxidase [Acidimicrobiia bacterium]|nr:pyridoxamine 5'-phosphate oxidase [Acidimicrobiia bacterium]
MPDTESLRVISWRDFAKREPDLARFGAGRLTAGPAYLATVRKSGAPRVHPVTPIFAGDGLFLFMEPTSPKRRDLLERGFFALHSGVPDNAGTGGEFSASGIGLAEDDPDLWALVAEAAGYDPPDRYVLFEFQVSEARCHGYGDVPLPSTRRWSVD